MSDRMAAMTLRLVPLTRVQARRFVGEHHRHNLPPVGDICRVGVEQDGELVGVGIVGRPNGRGLQDGYTVEILRVCTDGAKNACSMLYGACCRAAFALGYTRVITYTLESEPGSSLLAAGFQRDALLSARGGWDNGRPRYEVDLFGNKRSPSDEAKVRWIREAA